MRDDLPALAAEAFGYGYPLLSGLTAVERDAKTSPFNTFTHRRGLATPGPHSTNANVDVLRSTAQLDLSGGPLWLRIPATGDRYHVVQFIDAWTDNFAYVGSRSTSSDEREYLLVPPGWAGREAPAAEIIRMPTMVATLIARFACAGPADVPSVNALQDGLSIERMYPQVPLDGLPAPQSGVPDDVLFFETLRRSLAAFPPSPAERRYQQRFGPLGLFERGNSPYTTIPRDVRNAMREGLERGLDDLEEAATTQHAGLVNGWTNDLHTFDYNLDYFEVGTMDTPEWTVHDRDQAHRMRAVAARTGLWGNHAYEAVYPTVHKSLDNERLTGSQRYTVRFEQPPPVGAQWSLALYDAPDSRLVPNELDRYAIGSHTPGLHTGPDGSVTVTIQHERPADEEAANWLPAPVGGFRPVLRMYQPEPAVLHNEYRLPPVVPG
ncbi:DUF1254 domain-containing protein [Dactylosporangium sp. AC04546]|uniref:DUF1254 domain-containing protein n=1 Tax=Dactylosporangium sp. AC04546 TaxID=2862460 RepID=UPI001EDF5D07|nr:DUF1254 domain-containing protein [Dactylosporangium sp. AC04546]WVK82739.1 DUF1254 domain-containing protein [Dactylosporangium sp. AC04546]